jgi:hypothetical protein
MDKATGKSKFYYHQQNKHYAESQISLIKKSEILDCKAGNFKVEQLNSVQKINLKDSSLNSGGRSLVWSRTSACHADDPGSNLGDRTIHFNHY